MPKKGPIHLPPKPEGSEAERKLAKHFKALFDRQKSNIIDQAARLYEKEIAARKLRRTE